MPADTGDRARYPEYEGAFGDDPARWLDASLVDDPDRREMVRIRIFSIDDIDLARTWIEVERDIERGPRQQIVAWLNQRIKTLEAIGERPERLEFGPRRPPEMQPESQTDWYRVEDGERVPWDEEDRSVGLGSRGDLAVATDGGENDDA